MKLFKINKKKSEPMQLLKKRMIEFDENNKNNNKWILLKHFLGTDLNNVYDYVEVHLCSSCGSGHDCSIQPLGRVDLEKNNIDIKENLKIVFKEIDENDEKKLFKIKLFKFNKNNNKFIKILKEKMIDSNKNNRYKWLTIEHSLYTTSNGVSDHVAIYTCSRPFGGHDNTMACWHLGSIDLEKDDSIVEMDIDSILEDMI